MTLKKKYFALLTSVAISISPVSEIVATPLHDAVAQGNTDRIARLISEGHPVTAPNADGITPLMQASYYGRTDIMQQLVRAGANVNATDPYGRTALSFASQSGQIHAANILISQGANTNVLPPARLASLRSYDNRVSNNRPTPQRNTTSQRVFNVSKGQVTAGVLALAGIAGGLAAISGGGSGSDSAPTPVTGGTPQTITLPAAPSSALPSSFETVEYFGMGTLDQINASDAYARGYTGKNINTDAAIRVAVIDSGVQFNNADLNDNVDDANGFDFVADVINAEPKGVAANPLLNFQSHGTAAAGVIAAEKNDTTLHGVAPDAEIIPIRAFTSDGNTSDAVLTSSMGHAINRNAAVINNSWTANTFINAGNLSTRSDLESAISFGLVNQFVQAANNDIITVFAAGNEGLSQPSVESGAPLVLPELRDLWLTVGAVDSGNNLESFSNNCGLARDWCLVAPSDVLTTADPSDPADNDNDGYDRTLGTSFAAPHVAGAAAILLGAFPSLTPQQVVQILLASAQDLGAAGVDDVYGHGLLDLERATRPGDITVIPLSGSVSGASASLGSSGISSGAAFGAALQQNQSQFAFLDQWERSFLMNFSDVVNVSPHKRDLTLRFSDYSEAALAHQINVGKTLSLAYEIESGHHDFVSPEERDTTKARFLFERQSGNNTSQFGYNIDPKKHFTSSTHGEHISPENSISDQHYSPYLAFADEATSTAITHKSKSGHSLRAIAFQGSHRNDVEAHSPEVFSNKNSLRGTAVEAALSLGKDRKIGFETGMIEEKNHVLGSEFSGAFATQEDSRTYFSSASAFLPLYEHIALYGNYHIGVTRAQAAGQSLFNDIDNIVSDAFALGISAQHVINDNDNLSFSLSQPLRVRSGDASLTLPTGRDLDGNISRSSQTLGFTPDGREIDLELDYQMKLGNTQLSSGALVRFEPDHVKNADTEMIWMMKAKQQF